MFARRVLVIPAMATCAAVIAVGALPQSPPVIAGQWDDIAAWITAVTTVKS